LYDMRECDLSLACYTFSVKMALEVGDNDLHATALGRMVLVLLYARQPMQAQIYLHEAQQIPLKHRWIGAWLSAIEAELHASAKNWDAFTEAIKISKMILAHHPVGDDVYASITRFSSSMQLGFEGACLLRLNKPDAAVQVLRQSLSSLHPSCSRRRATLLTDIGTAHVLQGNVKEACSHFRQALDIIAQTKALIAFQRMYSALRKLDQWKHDPRVQALADHLSNTVVIIGRTNNAE
jgi:tetratricopeptide (TPR) repeat protein